MAKRRKNQGDYLVYITHEELCDKYDRLEAYYDSIPFYNFVQRASTKGAMIAVASLIIDLEMRASEASLEEGFEFN